MPNLLSLLPDLLAASGPHAGNAPVLPAGGGAGTLDFAGLLGAAGAAPPSGKAQGDGAPATAGLPVPALVPGAVAVQDWQGAPPPAASAFAAPAPDGDNAAATTLPGGKDLPGKGAQLPPLATPPPPPTPQALLSAARPVAARTAALPEMAPARAFLPEPVSGPDHEDRDMSAPPSVGMDESGAAESAAIEPTVFAVTAPPALTQDDNPAAGAAEVATQTDITGAITADVTGAVTAAVTGAVIGTAPPVPPAGTAAPARRTPGAPHSAAAIAHAAHPPIVALALSPATDLSATARAEPMPPPPLRITASERMAPHEDIVAGGAAAAAAQSAAAPPADSGDGFTAPLPASVLTPALAPAATLAPTPTELPLPIPSQLSAPASPLDAATAAPAPSALTPAIIAHGSVERGTDQRGAASAIESTIAQVGSLREALRDARPAMMVHHTEFGAVSVRLEQAAPDQWRAVLASRDPGFVPAIHAALETRAVAAAADASASFAHQNSASQNGAGDQRYGASPNGGQGSSQPYLGHSGSRDGETAPDHRRPSTAATLAGRSGEGEDGAASSTAASRAQGGLFA